MTKNLWGELPEINERSPSVILRQQAVLLSELTKGVLTASVKTSISRVSDTSINASFSIEAPAYDYVYRILEIVYPFDYYPLKFVLNVKIGDINLDLDCSDEQEFVSTLGKILSSDPVKKIISALLSELNLDA